MNIGYQGIQGAYSEAAVYQKFGRVQARGFRTFEDVFEALGQGEVQQAVLPIENSIAGSVAVNYDLLLKHDVRIVGEVYLPIRHALLGTAASLGLVKRALSHPQALQQCQDFLKKNSIEAVPEYDTAGAAKLVKERGNPEEAAIASEHCAELYELNVLARDIGSSKDNCTRFLIVARESPVELRKEKTSFVFKVRHEPGSLVNCLQRLAKHSINLTKLESRPLPDTPWEYVFHADIDGGTDDPVVSLALAEMEMATLFLRVVGSYPKARAPFQEAPKESIITESKTKGEHA
ncbi:MAG: prephenate dehydratase [Nanoarchaeota archaeon]|nr:prephenate dehydratase [Nanoarchaeota archaeon]